MCFSNSPLTCCPTGDPAVFGNLPPPSQAYEAVKWALDSHKYNGYAHSSGMLMAREAVVKEFSTPETPFTAEVKHNSCHLIIELLFSKVSVDIYSKR